MIHPQNQLLNADTANILKLLKGIKNFVQLGKKKHVFGRKYVVPCFGASACL